MKAANKESIKIGKSTKMDLSKQAASSQTVGAYYLSNFPFDIDNAGKKIICPFCQQRLKDRKSFKKRHISRNNLCKDQCGYKWERQVERWHISASESGDWSITRVGEDSGTVGQCNDSDSGDIMAGDDGDSFAEPTGGERGEQGSRITVDKNDEQFLVIENLGFPGEESDEEEDSSTFDSSRKNVDEEFLLPDNHDLLGGLIDDLRGDGTVSANCGDSVIPSELGGDKAGTNPCLTGQGTPVTEEEPDRERRELDDMDRPINYAMFDKFKEKCQKGMLKSGWTQDDLNYLRLLNLLEKAKAPTYLFDQIVDWARTSALDNTFDPGKKKPRRENFLERACEKQGFGDYKPIRTTIQLPKSGSKVQMTTFDFEAALFSILTSRSLMKRENLMFHDMDDPLAGPDYYEDFPDEHVFENLLSGKIARIMWKQNIRVPGKQIPVMIIFFVDGTHLDRNDRNHLEPLSFTLSLFNDDMRQKQEAWRVLAYVPNSAHFETESKPALRSFDYQFMMKNALQSVIDFQDKGSVYWEIPNYFSDGRKLKLEMLFCFGLLCGDMMGNNKACGHSCNHSAGESKLLKGEDAFVCRRCNTSWENFDNWDYKFKLHKRSTLMKTDGTRPSSAGKFGYYTVDEEYYVAFDLCFNGREKLDAHAITSVDMSPQDACHGRWKGPIERSVEVFRDFRLRPKDCKGSAYRVFSDKIRDCAEAALDTWGILLQNQSLRIDMRTHFKCGALSTSKLNANEYLGLVLLYLLLLSSTLGEYLFTPPEKRRGEKGFKASEHWYKRDLLGTNQVFNWAVAFEDMLLGDRFCRSKRLTEGERKLYKNYLPIYQTHLDRAWRRLQGMGNKVPKRHGMMHWPEDLLNYGPEKNYDSQTGECNLKDQAKNQHDKTQKRSSDLDYQVGKNYRNTSMLKSVEMEIECYLSNQMVDANWIVGSNHIEVKGCDYVFTLGREEDITPKRKSGFYKYAGEVTKKRSSMCGEEAKWDNEFYRKQLQDFLGRALLGSSGSGVFKLRNTYQRDGGALYHAQPGYVTQAGYRFGWNDWAFVSMGKNSEGREMVFPGQLLCFIDVHGMEENPWKDDKKYSNCEIKEDGCYVVCHIASKSKPQGELFSDGHYFCDMVTRYSKNRWGDATLLHLAQSRLICYIYPVSSIVGPCTCVPDIFPEERSGVGVNSRRDYVVSRKVRSSFVEFLMIEPIDNWKNRFVEKMKEHVYADYREEEDEDGDEDDFEEYLAEMAELRREEREKWQKELMEEEAEYKKKLEGKKRVGENGDESEDDITKGGGGGSTRKKSASKKKPRKG